MKEQEEKDKNEKKEQIMNDRETDINIDTWYSIEKTMSTFTNMSSE
jgi:hypothetical protein